MANKALADSAAANQALAARVDKHRGRPSGRRRLCARRGRAAAGGRPPDRAAARAACLASFRRGAVPPRRQDPRTPSQASRRRILAYRQARQVLDTGDYAGGAKALQDYLAQYPTSPRASEANYWLGRTLAVQNLHADAAAAYARSLKGWPQTTWAGDAVVRLSASLVELKRPDDACKALVEFDNRYAAKSPAAIKTRAKDARGQACLQLDGASGRMRFADLRC